MGNKKNWLLQAKKEKLEGIGSDGKDTEDMDMTNHPHCTRAKD